MEFEGLDSGSRVFLEPKGTTSPPDQAILIHFICGNPGLIQIYTPFLETLHSRLLKAWPSAPIYISGHSLKGFDMPVPGLGNAPKTELFTLEDQVKDQERLLKEYCKKARRRSGCAKDPKVILMGHSVGTWIMLNIIQQNLQSYDIIGGILLFPTIVDIASSSAGMFASVSGRAFLCLKE